MRAPRTALVITAVVVLLTACGAVPEAGAPRAPASPTQSPVHIGPSAPAPSATPTAPLTTSSPLPTQLKVSGPLSVSIQLPESASTCTVIRGGFEAQIPFTDGSTSYEVDIELLDYSGPSTYQIPPERVSIHTLGATSPSALFPMVSGTVAVASSQQSGTVDGTLGGARPGKLDGTWACT